MIYFGTDGIRGIVGEELTQEICFRCGNALAKTKKYAKIVIGRDTRTSGSFVLSSFVSGATMGGASVVDAGIVPTPAISFLTKKTRADYGVMITASHNPPEYNGIKIFDSEGKKIGAKLENEIERNFAKQKIEKNSKLGKYVFKGKLAKDYVDFVVNAIDFKLNGLKVVVDSANGASYLIAGKVFKKLGAKVTKINATSCGENINYGCGALHPEKLAQVVKKTGADIGFAFDGDADRVVAVDEKGETIDGDQIILFLTEMFKKFGLLKSHAVVATIQTNMGVEKQLEKLGLKLIRTDVGDKYVTDELCAKNLQIGGEQAGHIIMTDYCPTGDGILCAAMMSKFVMMSKEPISKNIFRGLYKQHSKNYVVSDKYNLINSAGVKIAISESEALLKDGGRVVVRASGTEPKIRVMVETQDDLIAQKIFAKLEKVILSDEPRN
jgi:phosphoglucosamine mutase